MAALTKEQFVEMHVFQGLSETEIAERIGVARTTVASYRHKYGFIPKSKRIFPRCPECGCITNLIRTEGLGFCSNCLVYVNARGEIEEVSD